MYEAAPGAEDIHTFAHPKYTTEGSYNPATNTIEYGNPSDFDASKGLMLHEIQHKIQEDENWAKGGSSREFYNQLLKEKEDIFNHINKLNDEMSVLAKNPQMTPEQRTAYDFLMNARQELVPEAQKYTDPVNLMQMAQDKYKSLAGEAEARLTQRRMNLTPEERLQYFPYANDKANYGLDMPFESLLVKK